MVSTNRLDTIWCRLACNTRFGPFIEEQDRKVYVRRATAEGAEFRVRGLASLRTDLLTGLETGQLVIRGRFRLKKGTSLPAFLYRAWAAVFNDDGRLRVVPNALAVACINQLSAVFSKLPGTYPPQAEQDVLDRFIANEAVLAEPWGSDRAKFQPLGCHQNAGEILRRASHLIRKVLCDLEPRDIMPSHGSGASACRTHSWERYALVPRYCREIDRIWGYADLFCAGVNHLDSILSDSLMPEAEELPKVARVLLVPKDYRGPRLISCEPRELMFIQQGLMWKLYNHIEQHPDTRGLVNFTDQSINQRLAHEGSITGALATLDLKDASDLVRWDIVQQLFPPNWVDALSASRSGATLLPTGETVVLNKFAPMGSSLCFPVMALTIWALLTASLPPDTKVFVYGDDLIIPTAYAERAISVLEAFDLKVNVNKSFSKGPFRESCGKEYVQGSDVTPLRLKTYPTDDVHDIGSLVCFANNLRETWGEESGPVTSLIKEWYPRVPVSRHRSECSFDEPLGWLSPAAPTHSERKRVKPLVLWDRYSDLDRLRRRLNRELQVREYWVLKPRCTFDKVASDDWGYVLRFLLKGGDLGATERAASNRCTYSWGWAAIE